MLWVLIRIASIPQYVFMEKFRLVEVILIVPTTYVFMEKFRLVEAILMSTHNIYFYGEIWKILSKLSQNTLLICSIDVHISAGSTIQPEPVTVKRSSPVVHRKMLRGMKTTSAAGSPVVILSPLSSTQRKK